MCKHWSPGPPGWPYTSREEEHREANLANSGKEDKGIVPSQTFSLNKTAQLYHKQYTSCCHATSASNKDVERERKRKRKRERGRGRGRERDRERERERQTDRDRQTERERERQR